MSDKKVEQHVGETSRISALIRHDVCNNLTGCNDFERKGKKVCFRNGEYQIHNSRDVPLAGLWLPDRLF